MSEAKDKTIALNVRLKSVEPSAHPRAMNYTNVGVAQGIAYLDFGFIELAVEPGLLVMLGTATAGQGIGRIRRDQSRHGTQRPPTTSSPTG